MSIPTDRKYTHDHEWLKIDGATGRVGLTDYAAQALGDVVYVDLPDVGAEITAGMQCGEIESTKSVSDLVAPASGRVSGTNADVIDAPERVNADPYGDGWLYEVEVKAEGDLLSPEEYRDLLESQDA